MLLYQQKRGRKNRARLEHRFSKSKIIPGTCSFHCVITSEYGLSLSNLSGEPSLYPLSVQRKGNEVSIDDIPVGSYVNCLFEKEWYVGVVEEASAEENNVLVKLLHSNDPSVYFIGPQLRINDRCQYNTYYNCSLFHLLTFQVVIIPS